MYTLCLNPEAARQLSSDKPKKQTDEQAEVLPQPAPEAAPAVAEEPPLDWSKDPRYAAAFAMIMYWSQHGGC